VLIGVPTRLEYFDHSRNRGKQTVLDHGDALFFIRYVYVSKQDSDMIGQFNAGPDAAGLHPDLQLRQKKAAPAVIAKQVVSEIGCAIGTQIEGVRVGLLELPEALIGNRVLETLQLCGRVRGRWRKFTDAIAERLCDGPLRIIENVGE
jgi:hypothetical protein